jgi:hypothetical protein
MSDEPQKRSRRWIGWALVAVFVLYPFSMGPASWMHLDRLGPVYRPLTILSLYCPRECRQAAAWYLELFR